MNTTGNALALGMVKVLRPESTMTVPAYLAALTEFSGLEHGCECGRSWLKLFRQDSRTCRSAIAFVCLHTGAVHRADSWKKPGRSLGFTLEVL